MSEATERQQSGAGKWIIALIILLLLIGSLGYFSGFLNQEDDGSFDLNFTGCDEQNRCADFALYSPGYDYRWSYGKTSFDPIDGAEPSLDPVVSEYLARTEGVIASGLASREGTSQMNRALSSCRSKRLAGLLEQAGGQRDNIYRVALGRYADDVTEREDTSIERLVVMAFILRSDEDVDLSQALKSGLSQDLPALLEALLPAVARQLEFTAYECWENEFSVTQTDVIRGECYREPVADASAFCGTFE